MSRPVTDETRKAQGNHRPGRSRPVPKLSASEPAMPPDLPEPAQRVWKRIVPELAAAKILTRVDADVLKLYCVKMAQFEADWGESMKAADVTQLRMLMAELGLTPASRLSTPPLEDEPDECQPPSGGNVVSMSDLLSNTRKRLSQDKSTPAGTSASPASAS